MKPTIEERLERLEKHGYTTYHLFGNWYLGRVWSKNFRRFLLTGFIILPNFNLTLEVNNDIIYLESEGMQW